MTAQTLTHLHHFAPGAEVWTVSLGLVAARATVTHVSMWGDAGGTVLRYGLRPIERGVRPMLEPRAEFVFGTEGEAAACAERLHAGVRASLAERFPGRVFTWPREPDEGAPPDAAVDARVEAAADALYAAGRFHHWWRGKLAGWRQIDPIGRDEFLAVVEDIVRAYVIGGAASAPSTERPE